MYEMVLFSARVKAELSLNKSELVHMSSFQSFHRTAVKAI